MSIEVHILGTAGARPSSTRQVSGSLVSCEEGIVVVDAGEGFQTRFLQQRKRMKRHEDYHLKPSKVAVLCLSHGHLDHTWGVLPWLQSMALDNRKQPLLILGPTTNLVIDALLNNRPLPDEMPNSDLAIQFQFWQQLGAFSSNLGYPVRWVLGAVEESRWIEFQEGGKVVELSDMPQPEGWYLNRIEALPTVPSMPSCAWQLSAFAKPGKFDRAMAEELKLTDSERGKLAAGEDIEHNGELLLSKNFRGQGSSPLSVVISGDTSEMASGIISLDNCSVLIHEATFLDEYSKHADDYLHSTASGAARTAIQCGAGHLVLTHYGARIKDTNESKSEAIKVLANSEISVTAADDGDRILVDDNGDVLHLSWTGNGWNS